MTTTQTDEIKTWQQRLEETCPALGPMHIHACVEEVNDAMQAEIDDLRVALQEQAREGEAVANSAILARGRFHAFKGENGEPDDWEWFEEGTNCEHGCIDAVIVRADAIAAPQPVQPSEPAQPVAQPLTDEDCTSIKEMGKHAFRALDKAASVICTIEPESDSERDNLDKLITEIHDVAMSLFTVCGLPMQEAERYFYKKQSHGIGGGR